MNLKKQLRTMWYIANFNRLLLGAIMKSTHLIPSVLMALLVFSGCKKEIPVAGPHAESSPPQQVSTLENNLLDLYQANTTVTSNTRRPKPKKTVVNDIDSIPDFRQAFDSDDLAVVIGVEFYQKLPPVEFSSNDARLVRDYLLKLGFDERNIRFITNEDATEAAIRVSVDKWLLNNSISTSRVFFYYSGHGSPEPTSGDAYLVPYDGDPNYLADTSYPIQKLYTQLGSMPAQEVIVVIDACFSGIGNRSVLAKGVRAITMRPKELAPPSHMTVLSATREKEIATSFPEKQHGLFTYYFLQALHSGKKSVPEIYEYIKPKIEDEASRQNVSQSPKLTSGAQGTFHFFN